jgi:fructose-bisphosphate aldolase class 1
MAYRTELIIKRLMSVVPAADALFTIDLPRGRYQVAVYTKSTITAGATLSFKAFTDKDQTQVSTDVLQLIRLSGTAVLAAGVLVLTGGANQGDAAHILKSANAAINPDIILPYGLQAVFTKGTAVAGETLVIDVIAVRLT